MSSRALVGLPERTGDAVVGAGPTGLALGNRTLLTVPFGGVAGGGPR